MERVSMSDITAINPDELVADTVAAPMLGVMPGTMAIWRSKGKGPAYVKTGRTVRYWVRDLHQYIAANRRTSTKINETP
jgi:hypothetical protein